MSLKPELNIKGKCSECRAYTDCPRMKGASYCLSIAPAKDSDTPVNPSEQPKENAAE